VVCVGAFALTQPDAAATRATTGRTPLTRRLVRRFDCLMALLLA
jgi:hypothetical protein